MRFENGIEPVEHHAWLNGCGGIVGIAPGSVGIERHQLIEMLRMVDDQRGPHGLATLRRATTAGEDRHLQVARDIQRNRQIGLGLGYGHAQRLNLINRGVSGIAATRGGIKQHIAAHLARQAHRQVGARQLRRQEHTATGCDASRLTHGRCS